MSYEKRFEVGDKVIDTDEHCIAYGVGEVVSVTSIGYIINFPTVSNKYSRTFEDKDLILSTPLMEALL